MGKVVIPGFRKIETSGGGEGGTTNYNDLTNKPLINNVPLVGNLNTVNLKLTDATLTEEGVPAEAKVVGTKLEEHSASLTALSRQLGNHTVKSDVPENAVFTDTVYDDTEVKESIDELNSNLSDYVMDNKCSNLVNGYYNADDGSLVTNYNPLRYICSTNSYYLKKGEIIRVNGNSVDSIYFATYDTNGSFINRKDYYDKKDVTYIAQDNIIIKWSVSFSTDTPISQSPHIGVYVNNAIDELKNDLVWKFHKKNVGTTSTDYPTNVREIMIIAKANDNVQDAYEKTVCYTAIIPYMVIGSDGARLNIDRYKDISVYFNGSGQCQGNNDNYDYSLYYR